MHVHVTACVQLLEALCCAARINQLGRTHVRRGYAEHWAPICICELVLRGLYRHCVLGSLVDAAHLVGFSVPTQS